GVGDPDPAGAFPPPAFFSSSSLDFFFSCLARSSALVSLVNAIFFPSGAQLGFPAPFGRSVKVNESPACHWEDRQLWRLRLAILLSRAQKEQKFPIRRPPGHGIMVAFCQL